MAMRVTHVRMVAVTSGAVLSEWCEPHDHPTFTKFEGQN